jgi:hypothetical protein
MAHPLVEEFNSLLDRHGVDRERLSADLKRQSRMKDGITAVRQQILEGLTDWIRAHDPEEALDIFAPMGWTHFAIMCVERANLTNALSFEELCEAWILIGGSLEVEKGEGS